MSISATKEGQGAVLKLYGRHYHHGVPLIARGTVCHGGRPELAIEVLFSLATMNVENFILWSTLKHILISNIKFAQVRAAYEEMGDFLAQRGDLQGSLKHHLRSRDFCSSHAQMVSACLRVIGVATELNNLVQVCISGCMSD
jgi:hypothetical protein